MRYFGSADLTKMCFWLLRKLCKKKLGFFDPLERNKNGIFFSAARSQIFHFPLRKKKVSFLEKPKKASFFICGFLILVMGNLVLFHMRFRVLQDLFCSDLIYS